LKTQFHNFLQLLIITLFLANTSCKSSKKTISSTSETKNSSFKKLEKLETAHFKNAFEFTHLQSRLQVNYKDAGKQIPLNVSLRMQKDEKIWLSVKFMGITGAKALLTPEKISFYEKIKKRAYEGDYSFASQFLGFEVDFYQIQNLILGQILSGELAENQKTLSENDSYFEITCANANQKCVNTPNYYLFKQHLKSRSTQITSKEKEAEVQIDYPVYQNIDSQYLPEKIAINIKPSDPKKSQAQKEIKVLFRNTSLSDGQNYPFSIPSGYKLVNH